MQKQSAILRILLHAFFLISVNIFSVTAAVLVMYLMKIDGGEMTQSGIALLINLMIYLLIYWLMRGIGAMIMQIDDFFHAGNHPLIVSRFIPGIVLSIALSHKRNVEQL
jgi:uncharacterized membrane protein